MLTLKRLVSIWHAVFAACAEISSALIFIMMLLVTADVFGRYALSNPVPATFELSKMLMVFIVFLAYAHTEATGQNIRVQIIDRHITQRQKDLLDAFTYLLGIFVFGVICWQGWKQAWLAVELNQRMWGVVRLPLWPAKFVLVAGAGLLVLQFFIGFVSSIPKILHRSSG